MSFLAPLFLVGALAVAAPVIFHLIRHTTREKKLFSSLMFLLPSPPRLTRRSRLEHLLLLALRCLVLCLLAAGFARPFIKKTVVNEAPSATARRLVLMVDTSASMKRADLWTDARDRVETVLRKTTPMDQVAVFTFDREIRPVLTFEQWNAAAAGERVALVRQRLTEISPGWSSTHLGHALIDAAETLTDTDDRSASGPRQIVVVSDLQEGSRLDQLQGYEWPRGIELTLESLKPKHVNNAGIQLVAEADEADRQTNAVVRVRVNNATDSRQEQFQVGWMRPNEKNFAGAPLDVYVPPGQSRIVTVPAPASGVAPDRIGLQGDDEDFDNTVFTVPPAAARLSVLYFGGESAKDSKQPLYFLERAFQETRRQVVQVLARQPDAVVPTSEAQAARLYVITGALPEPLIGALQAEVAAGKTALLTLRSETAASLARLCGAPVPAVEEIRPAAYAMLAEIDFTHPLFAPFADPRFSDFTRIHFWKYRRVDAAAIPGARTVAKFDNGDPALLEVPVGKGRLLVLTSGWQPEDSQLALSTKFVPLLYSTLDYSGAAAPPPAQYFVGDVVPLARTSAAGPATTVRAPDGSQSNLAAGEDKFSRTTMPGIYQLASTQPPGTFAVNLDGSESRTAPLNVEELERLGAPLTYRATPAARAAGQEIRLQNAELENRQKLWRWVLVATLAVLLFETWLAGRTARRLTVTEGATS
jgi:aerotolerance regulator-like protein/VWA domain-containing protein